MSPQRAIIALGNVGRRSATGEHRLETGFREDALHLFPFVALDFNAAILDRTANAAGFLHFFGEFLFLRQPDADEIFCHGDSLAAAMGGLADDVHPASVRILLAALGGLRGGDRSLGQIAETGQRSEWI